MHGKYIFTVQMNHIKQLLNQGINCYQHVRYIYINYIINWVRKFKDSFLRNENVVEKVKEVASCKLGSVAIWNLN